MTDTTYNGWTNYATWRVALELFDGVDPETIREDTDNTDSLYDYGRYLQEYAEQVIEEGTQNNSLALNYAFAFLQDVNWYEIALHLAKELEEHDRYEREGV